MIAKALLFATLMFAACQGFERVAPPGDARAAHDASADSSIVGDLGCGSCEPEALVEGLHHVAAIDLDQDHVYWADAADLDAYAHVGRVPKGGCAAGVQCAEVLAPQRFAITALRVSQGYVFWSERYDDVRFADTGSIWRLTLEGRVLKELAPTQNQPLDLLVHEDTLYWANEAEIRRRNAWAETAEIGLVQQSLARPIALAISMQRLFFSNLGGDAVPAYVVSTRLDGSDWQVIAENQSTPVAIAVGPLYVYWADSTRGVVMRAQSDGLGLVSAFLSNLKEPNAVLVHDGTLYVAEAGTKGDYTDGKIIAVRLDGTGRTTLAENQLRPHALAIDESALYWANYGTSSPTGYNSSVMKLVLP